MLKGVVRIENLETPEVYIEGLLSRVKVDYLKQTYGVDDWNGDAHTFLEKYALKTGKLLKGGEADTYGAAKMVLRDWQRGRLPYFVCPPFEDDIARAEAEKLAASQPKVEQMFSKINVRSRFDAEDSKPPAALLQVIKAEEEAEAKMADSADADGTIKADWDEEHKDVDGEEADAEEAERLLNIKPETAGKKRKRGDDDAEEAEEEEEEAAAEDDMDNDRAAEDGVDSDGFDDEMAQEAAQAAGMSDIDAESDEEEAAPAARGGKKGKSKKGKKGAKGKGAKADDDDEDGSVQTFKYSGPITLTHLSALKAAGGSALVSMPDENQSKKSKNRAKKKKQEAKRKMDRQRR